MDTHNELQQACVRNEAIVRDEHEEVRAFLVRLTRRNAHERPTDDSCIVVGDIFFNQKNGRVVWDPKCTFCCILFSFIWLYSTRCIFQTVCNNLEPLLKQMDDFRIKTNFKNALKRVMLVLEPMTARYGRTENDLFNYSKKRSAHSVYELG